MPSPFPSPHPLLPFLLLISTLPSLPHARELTFPALLPQHQHQFPQSLQQQQPYAAFGNGGQQQPPFQFPHHAFAGLATFANTAYVDCLAGGGGGGGGDEGKEVEIEGFDIAFLGAGFDTGVTARPGARYGPRGIRWGSSRMQPDGYSIYTDPRAPLPQTHPPTHTKAHKPAPNRPQPQPTTTRRTRGTTRGKSQQQVAQPMLTWRALTGKNSYGSWAKVVDCGDAPLTFLDNTVALKQLDWAHKVVASRTTNSSVYTTPRIITLGGDHTTTLSALRSTREKWGPVSVIHFDSHIDTWDPEVLGGGISHYAGVNHGTFLHIAHEEGLIRNTSIHAGIRAPVTRRKGDVRNDIRCGFDMIKARELDRIGIDGVIERLKKRVAGSRVYISVDIDVLDPAFAPATGTAEPGGWSTRELLSIIDGLTDLDVVGADVVEVAPIYDNPGETTVLAAAQVADSLLALMVQRPVKS